MVRNLVKLHGGSVRAFSEGPGRGSESRASATRGRDCWRLTA
jgi:hypothetical protein